MRIGEAAELAGVEAAIRWAFRVNAWDFRHTRNFLKSLIPKDAETVGFSTIFHFRQEPFLPRHALNCPVALAHSG